MNRTIRRILLIITHAAALSAAFAVLRPQPAHADPIQPPSVPSDIEVRDGSRPFLISHAVGTQGYICLPSGAGFAWTLFGPQATLFNDRDEQEITHFLSPNPEESGTPRATWQHSRDTSSIWAVMIASSIDPAFVEPGAIPWFLLRKAGAQEGPTGGDRLQPTTFIPRINTTGGVAPATGCALSADVGRRALVAYTADYVFYR